MKINFGCGNDIQEGYVNYDLYPLNNRVLKIDLNILPLPFKDNSIDVILCKHILEHLTVDPLDFIKELYRILKKNGVLYISLPSFSFSLEHKRCYHPIYYFDSFIDYNFVKIKKQGYYFEMFKLVKRSYNFSLKLFLKRIYELFISMGSKEIRWELIKHK